MAPDIKADGGPDEIRKLHISSFGSLESQTVCDGTDPKGRAPAGIGAWDRNESNLSAAFEDGRQLGDGVINDPVDKNRFVRAFARLAAGGKELEAVSQIGAKSTGNEDGIRRRRFNLALPHNWLLLPKWTLRSSIGVTPHNQVAVDEDV
jgi:hypothetical protein